MNTRPPDSSKEGSGELFISGRTVIGPASTIATNPKTAAKISSICFKAKEV
jgi:hypothetical protein